MYVNKSLTHKSRMAWAYATFLQTFWLDEAWDGVPDCTWVESLTPARQRAYDRAQWYSLAQKSELTSEQSARYEAAYREWRRCGKTTAAALRIAETLR